MFPFFSPDMSARFYVAFYLVILGAVPSHQIVFWFVSGLDLFFVKIVIRVSLGEQKLYL